MMRARSSIALGPACLPLRVRHARAGSTPFSLHHVVSVLFWRMNPTFAACSTFGSGEEAVRMTQVLDSGGNLRLSLAKELSSSFAELLPAAGNDGYGGDDTHRVLRFLLQVAHALRVKEAELARLQGISQATQSSWKKRGAIPEKQLEWFRVQFVPLVMTTVPWVRASVGFYDIGFPVALAIFDQTDFDPFGDNIENRAERMVAAYQRLPVLGNLGGFVASQLGCRLDKPGFEGDVYERIAPKTLHMARLGLRLAELSPPKLTVREDQRL
jgi:hypothetical protein